jgi:biopolymer transport protein ExbD
MEKRNANTAPYINVTPLIDVLLVLLIIFMVVAPQRPHRFKAQIPEPPPPQQHKPAPDPNNLVVSIGNDQSLQINQTGPFGSVNDPAPLIAKLEDVFRQRVAAAGNVAPVKRAVFLKAPRRLAYGEVAKVIDSIKTAGANPVGLQVDALEP